MDILERITPLEGASGHRAEAVARKLEILITNSKLVPGTLVGTKEDLRCRVKVSPGTLNEALRLLTSRGVITMRRGVKGGIFVAAPSLEIALEQFRLEVGREATVVAEESLAVLKQLEPLVIIEAIKTRTDDAVNELNQSVGEVTTSTLDEPIASLRWSWYLYRKIAEMGSNAVLSAIYTMLLTILERKPEEIVRLANNPTCERVVARVRLLVEAIAFGDVKRASAVLQT